MKGGNIIGKVNQCCLKFVGENPTGQNQIVTFLPPRLVTSYMSFTYECFFDLTNEQNSGNYISVEDILHPHFSNNLFGTFAKPFISWSSLRLCSELALFKKNLDFTDNSLYQQLISLRGPKCILCYSLSAWVREVKLSHCLKFTVEGWVFAFVEFDTTSLNFHSDPKATNSKALSCFVTTKLLSNQVFLWVVTSI